MAAVLPKSDVEVLEEGDEALLPESKVEEGEEFASLDEEESPKPEPKAKKGAKKDAPAVEEGEDDLPADLKGKSAKEIAKMLKEAQSLIGRQGSELGEFRKKADQLIQASLAQLQAQKQAAPAAKPAEEVDDETEFFAKPKEAIAKAIANHPLIQEIRKTLGDAAAAQQTQRATAATQRFNTAHPDAAEVMADPEFRKWVEASPVRRALLQRAHTQFDFDSGDEVFGTWKALKGVAKPAEDDAGAAEAAAAARALAKRKEALKAAGVPTSGASGGVKESGSKKIYRRADVIKLMAEDNERYLQLAPEIEAAYREGRVR